MSRELMIAFLPIAVDWSVKVTALSPPPAVGFVKKIGLVVVGPKISCHRTDRAVASLYVQFPGPHPQTFPVKTAGGSVVTELARLIFNPPDPVFSHRLLTNRASCMVPRIAWKVLS